VRHVRRLAVGASVLFASLAGAAGLRAQTAPAGPPFDEARLAQIARAVGVPAGRLVEGGELEAITEEITGKLRCPVCQGLAVSSSHTPTALAMKEQARQLVRLGYSESQILAVFEDSYGEFVRLSPKPQGFNLVVWWAPILVLAGGVALVARRLRRSGNVVPPSAGGEAPTPAAPGADPPPDPPIDPYLKKLREEIRRR
jgi:cytochrome c-type biogenesis protein CcmH